MAKAYSLDLRKKVFEAYNKSKTKDKLEIAKRFDVSYDFVNNLVNLYKETGSLSPRPRRGKKATTINEESLKYLEQLVKENNDYTLSELSEKLNKEMGIKSGITVVFRALRKLGLA